MHADLVGPPRLGHNLETIDSAKSLDNLVPGFRLFRLGMIATNGHLVPLVGMRPDWQADHIAIQPLDKDYLATARALAEVLPLSR